MSVLAMTWAWGRSVGHPAQKLVLMALADHADDRGICHPGIERIAQKVELAPRTVRRYLGQLEEDGHIQRRRRRRKNGTLGTYQYRLRIPRQEEDQRPSAASGLPRPVAVSDQWPSQVHTSGLSSGRAEPSVEPPVEEAPPPPPLTPPGPELERYFGDEHQEAVIVLRALPGWSSVEERTFVSRFSASSMQGELLFRGVPSEMHPEVLAEAVYQYVERRPGDPPPVWSAARFRGWANRSAVRIREAVEGRVAAGAGARASPAGGGRRRAGGELDRHIERWGGLEE